MPNKKLVVCWVSAICSCICFTGAILANFVFNEFILFYKCWNGIHIDVGTCHGEHVRHFPDRGVMIFYMEKRGICDEWSSKVPPLCIISRRNHRAWPLFPTLLPHLRYPKILCPLSTNRQPPPHKKYSSLWTQILSNENAKLSLFLVLYQPSTLILPYLKHVKYMI